MAEESFITEYNAEEKGGIWSFWIRNARELIRFRHAIYNFVVSNLRARYRRSTFGFFWSLLNPLFTMVILSVVFSTIFKNSLANFSIYIFSGLLPWTMIFNSILNGAMALISAERFLKKVYIPKIIFPIAIVSVEAINFLLSLISLFFLAIFLGAKISWVLFTLPLALLITALFLLGLVMFVSMLNVYFRDLFHIVQVVFTGLFYLTPIVYPLEFVLNSPLLSVVVRLNPFLYFIELFHSIIYRAEIPGVTTWGICIVLTLTSMFIGSLVFFAKENDVVYRL
ncbi:MAG: ABC transporter permease [Anaerolineales bacterium]|nr:ABC transporter permease [Anaerolineales bacterium]